MASKTKTKNIALLCAKLAIDKKSLDNVVLDISHSDFADFFVICSGTSTRHTAAIAENIEGELRKKKVHCSVEGASEGEWILVDAGDVIVHIFHEPQRENYALEEVWAKGERVEIPNEYYTSIAGEK